MHGGNRRRAGKQDGPLICESVIRIAVEGDPRHGAGVDERDRAFRHGGLVGDAAQPHLGRKRRDRLAVPTVLPERVEAVGVTRAVADVHPLERAPADAMERPREWRCQHPECSFRAHQLIALEWGRRTPVTFAPHVLAPKRMLPTTETSKSTMSPSLS